MLPEVRIARVLDAIVSHRAGRLSYVVKAPITLSELNDTAARRGG